MGRLCVVVASFAVLAIAGCGDDDAVGATTASGDAGGGGRGGGGTTTTGGGGSGGSGGSGVGLGPPSVARIGDTFEIPSLAETAPKRFVDAAFDPEHDGYLVVNGNAAIGASFVDAGGAPVGSPVAVAQTAAWAQGVRAGYGSGAQGFLVAWHDARNDPASASLFARIVRWDGAALSFADDDFPVSESPTYQEAAPAIAYAAGSDRFLVAWQRSAGSDIRARFVSAQGALVGQEIAITDDPDWQSDVAIAHHPVKNEMLVSYTHAGATTEVRVQRVAMDGSLVGGPVGLTSAGGTWLTQSAYLPSSGGYLVAWYEGALRAVRLDADATPLSAPFELAPGYGAYDGFAMAMSPATERFVAVMHGTTDEDFAAAFDATGEQSSVVQATDSPGEVGHFNPHVAAHASRAEWLLVTSLGFQSVVGQRLGP